MDPSVSANLHEEYSASSTIVHFDYPIPLLRGPVRAGVSDDPSFGPYVLAFRDHRSWAAAYKRCESKIIEQCEAGSRIGCAISASEKCKPPWWRNFIGGNLPSLKDREICEEREMEGCLVAAKDKCVGLAKEKSSSPFRDARIAIGERMVMEKVGRKLVCLVSMPENSQWMNLIGFDKRDFDITNQRASEFRASETH
ncbi:hypothetical protein M5689_003379 [Euphorbia peplus]|nr:hypothetical protein M5689_003379 [Euphorbia peplus]